MKYAQQYMVFISILVFAIVILPARLYGQEVGQRVRVTLIPTGLVELMFVRDIPVGQITEVTESGFVMDVGESELREIKRSQIDKLEVHTGTERSWLLGMGLGCGLGLALAHSESKEVLRCSSDLSDLIRPFRPCRLKKEREYTNKGYAMMLIGVLSGTILGSMTKIDKWETVTVDMQSVFYGGDTIALKAHIRF